MSESKGSRDVSLGPYRSTRLSLDDRLNDKESRELAKTIEKKTFGLAQYDSLGLTQIVDMLSALGYQKESDNLFVNKSGKFVYLSDLIDGVGDKRGNMRLISGDYSGNLESIASDIKIIEEMAKHYNQDQSKQNSLSYAASTFALPFCSAVGLGYLVNYFVNDPHHPFVFLAGLGAFAISGFGKIGFGVKRYRDKMSNLASSLSNDASKYSFGKKVYDQILLNYFEMTKPKQLETSEVAQLPEMEDKK